MLLVHSCPIFVIYALDAYTDINVSIPFISLNVRSGYDIINKYLNGPPRRMVERTGHIPKVSHFERPRLFCDIKASNVNVENIFFLGGKLHES